VTALLFNCSVPTLFRGSAVETAYAVPLSEIASARDATTSAGDGGRSRTPTSLEIASDSLVGDDQHVRADLPTGTVTFLFTDVAGSTNLLHEHGDGYAELLAGHRTIVRTALARNSGVEVDTQGDAFFAAFPRATDAVAAADEIRDGLSGGPVRVRMGIHTGEPLVTQEGYVGLDVHRAARIAAAAHGGQVVMSRSTRDLLASNGEVFDLGEHRLKDLLEAERLFQLGEGEFPPLRTLDTTNLPVAASPLLGREREVRELLDLLSDRRLVAITGPGGTGKTRLALQVAAELVGTVSDGVFWVPLASLTDADLVASEIAQAIGAPDDLNGFLRDRELVLLLDNFEHLLCAAPTVAGLLAGAAGLRLLVTSRAPLRVSGEVEYPLDPLDPTDAVALFVERARAVGRDLEPDETVEALCARLDSLPLAIELAAARTRLLAPAALLARLERALPLLTDGSRDAPERQRTLRATIEWSYDLLDEDPRRLLARLAVFAGSFPLETAESVCDAKLGELSALVDLSLLKPTGDERLLMLETIREYGLERLAEAGEEETFRARHAEEFARLAETAYERRAQAEAEWSSRLERDHDDLRAALDWLAKSNPDAALELAGALGWFWFTRGHLVEGDARLTAALAAADADSRGTARALTASGSLRARVGLVDEGRLRLEQAVGRWRELGDRAETAAALEALGWLLVYDAGDDEASLAAFEEARAIHQELGDRAGETRALVGVCQLLVALDEVERAEALSRELLERGRDDVRTRHFAIHFLADCSLIRGDCAEAESRYRESLRAALELGDVFETSIEVQGIAMALAGQGDSTRALELAAAVEALWRSLGTDLHVAFWDRLLDRHLGRARSALGAEADEARARGFALAFDDAVALALEAV
jgi:predicted ATPase/class 3 adenylate cyclase